MTGRYFKQSGHNDAFPEEIEIWKLGDPIPEWLSDRCKVSFLDGDGNITIETRETSSGGIDIINASGIGTLVELKSRRDYVCKERGNNNSRIFSLSEIQLNLLYQEKLERK